MPCLLSCFAEEKFKDRQQISKILCTQTLSNSMLQTLSFLLKARHLVPATNQPISTSPVIEFLERHHRKMVPTDIFHPTSSEFLCLSTWAEIISLSTTNKENRLISHRLLFCWGFQGEGFWNNEGLFHLSNEKKPGS